MLKLGYKASAEQFAPAKLLDFACMAEKIGFDSAFVSDHFQPWKHVDGHAPSSLVWLGEMYLLENKPAAATPSFMKALSLEPRSGAARYGLGRAELAKQDYAQPNSRSSCWHSAASR